jgi:hypothetical protein
LFLGDAVTGKTTFTQLLERRMWQEADSRLIPLRIELRHFTVDEARNCLANIFPGGEEEIAMLRQLNQPFLFIFDGYDEMKGGGYLNLWEANQLRLWPKGTRAIITCRPEYLTSQNKVKLFSPGADSSLLMERFSSQVICGRLSRTPAATTKSSARPAKSPPDHPQRSLR